MKTWTTVKEDLRFYGALLSCIGRGTSSRDSRWPRLQWIAGHRGARTLAPENTLSSFRLAIMHGADGVEFDVIPSRDGIPMVIHDDTLERTTSGKGLVWQRDKDELASLDATILMPGFKPEGIPTLAEVLRAMPDKALVNIELKNHGHLSKFDFVERVVRDVRPHEARLVFIISSFDPELLLTLRKQRTNLLLAQLLSKREGLWRAALKNLRRLRPDALHLSPDLATPFALMLARMAPMHVAVWTINDPSEVKSLFKKGIAGIFTDDVPHVTAAVRTQA